MTSVNNYSQNESANWFFGEYAGLSFNSGSPVALQSSQLNTNEGCASISSPAGDLLFYTDGTTVWNRQHQIMMNGTDLLGHRSSTMSALIIQKPGDNKNAFYIFTIDKPSYYLTKDEPIDGINYSEVDMTLDNGMGGIIPDNKNTHLITYDVNDPIQNEYKTSEKITAVTHSNGADIWVITQFINKFHVFLIDDQGVNLNSVTSTVSETIYPRIDDIGSNISAIGYMKVSPNGKKIAIAHSSTRNDGRNTGSKKTGKVLLYDFNNITGTVSNQKHIISDTYPYGVEFSPNSKLLYITTSDFTNDDVFTNSNLFQYDAENSTPSASQKLIHTSNFVAGALQLAIDGKIYRAGYKVLGNGTHLSVINSPNEIGNDANYKHNIIDLAGKKSKLGLPPFIQSIFKFTFDYENTCYGDKTLFTITIEDPYDSAFWDFGDGNTSTDVSPQHTYAKPGIYNVSLSLTLNGVTNDPFIKQVIISEPPKVLPTPFELVQCDSFDQDPDDGIATFNLELANGPLTYNTTTPIKVYFYQTLAEALADENNVKALNPVYRNQVQNEKLVAKVYKNGTVCFSLAEVLLTTTQSIPLKTFELLGCDLENNGSANFNLDEARQHIISTLNLSSTVTVSFYSTLGNAEIGINSLPDQFSTQATTVFIRAESDNVCYGSGQLELKTRAFPELYDQNIMVCESDFPLEISSGITTKQIENYNYLWDSGQNTNSILIFEEGNYQVKVKDPLLQCEKNITITIIRNKIAFIESITINDTDATINLDQPNDGFEFSVDDEFGIYKSGNLFLDVSPGVHTAFVRDQFQCQTISKEFSIIGFPKYFTPNNDGHNDFWNIQGLDPQKASNTMIKIFDRYGKLLFFFNPLKSEGWNGKYQGKLLAPDDYWYHYNLYGEKDYIGHFSLKI